MDEKTLSATLVASNTIPAVCFKSGLGSGDGGADYQTVVFSVSLDTLKDAIDNSMSDTVHLRVNNELGHRQFRYGMYKDHLSLVETCLLDVKAVVGFTPQEMRAASWRSQKQPVAA